MKDNFSLRSDNYAKFRPSNPSNFFDYLDTLIISKENAWDCGTGNGQVALQLSKSFQNVYASDISQSQLDNAFKAKKIHYSKQPSEKTNFNKNTFDLIIAAQAIHWFDFEKFYDEVKRTSKENGIICIVDYGRVQVSEEIDNIINHFYTQVIGKYWDKERRYIDKNYQSIPFPFSEIQAPKFINEHLWSLEHFIGYLNTWSAVKHFIKSNNFNPAEEVEKELNRYWAKDEFKKINFPILLRIGISK